ncbi:hypothetical protein, conserved [Eimeria acervulina]|uniref:Transmembrane protein n=1 Tax=Eimeria acervulina TaxID=5801 RepID=U6GDC8_EIMAC|nr:hypothetical protein, conserved [Eimeria acervulina]CDI78276.1 hypothetical protein, conserved [Eimeria acervulina]
MRCAHCLMDGRRRQSASFSLIRHISGFGVGNSRFLMSGGIAGKSSCNIGNGDELDGFDCWGIDIDLVVFSIACKQSAFISGARFESFFITGDFFRFFFWNLIMALFGNLGYAGGLGIICGSFTLLVAFFSLVCLCACNGSAKLNLDPFNKQELLDF